MTQHTELELISFNICPFVQRSVIALNEKNIDFKITHIDLSNPPEWFKKISPLGKVPVLKVGDNYPDIGVVFESAVILEYLDEIHAPQLHPSDPLEKATHRSWMEFCSDMIMTQHGMFTAKEQQGFEEKRDELKDSLKRLDTVVAESGSFFAGEEFSLVDTVYAPLFIRLKIVEAIKPLDLDIPERIQTWADALLARESVKNSMDEDFQPNFKKYFRGEKGYLFRDDAINNP